MSGRFTKSVVEDAPSGGSRNLATPSCTALTSHSESQPPSAATPATVMSSWQGGSGMRSRSSTRSFRSMHSKTLSVS
jgi:hypothetical protein